MKKLAVALFAALFAAVLCAGEPPKGWTTDIEAAIAQARREKKAVLLLFTGSDWCGYCKQLKSQTLDSGKFRRFAKNNLVPVYFDFPRKNRPDEKQMAIQNEWAKKFDVKGYPTTVILNGTGRQLTTIVGSMDADRYIQKIKAAIR